MKLKHLFRKMITKKQKLKYIIIVRKARKVRIGSIVERRGLNLNWRSSHRIKVIVIDKQRLLVRMMIHVACKALCFGGLLLLFVRLTGH